MTDSEIHHPQRPGSLTALCLLAFAGSGAGFIIYFLASVFFEKASEIIIRFSSMHSTEALSPLYFTLFMMFSAISLVGAIRMWKLHRDGFFIYTTAQIVMLVLPWFWLGIETASAPGIIFTLVFIAGYAFNWKKLS